MFLEQCLHWSLYSEVKQALNLFALPYFNGGCLLLIFVFVFL